MKLTKAGAKHFHGTKPLAEVDLRDVKIVVVRERDLLQLCFLGRDGSSSYSYTFEISLDEFSEIQTSVFEKLRKIDNPKA